jgi:hypothetical protein
MTGFSLLTAFEHRGARRKRGVAPRKTTSRPLSGTKASNANRLTPGKTFAFLSAAAALSAIKMF